MLTRVWRAQINVFLAKASGVAIRADTLEIIVYFYAFSTDTLIVKARCYSFLPIDTCKTFSTETPDRIASIYTDSISTRIGLAWVRTLIAKKSFVSFSTPTNKTRTITVFATSSVIAWI
jgi:hypothetical protein